MHPNTNTHRIQRDVAVRGRDVAGVLDQYQKFVKPAFDGFVAPSRRHADVIIPWTRYTVCLCVYVWMSVFVCGCVDECVCVCMCG